MNKKSFIKVIGSAGLAFAFVIMAGMTGSMTTQAQWSNNEGYHQYGQYSQQNWDRDRERRFAYVLGYHTAYTEGSENRYNRMSYRDHEGYRDSSNGYLTFMGDEDTYRDYYRRGFKDGFEDGQRNRTRKYNRNDVERLLGANLQDVYGGNDRWSRRERDRNRDRDRYDRDRDRDRYDRNDVMRTAQQNGYRDGLERGREDRSRNRRYNLDDSSRYRDAMSGYRGEYGDRNRYRDAYREGFRRGYEDGYRNQNSRRPIF